MKKLFSGFIAGAILSSYISVFGMGGINTAEFNNLGIRFNGEKLDIDNQLISIGTYRQSNLITYMPMRDVLERMGYFVLWNSNENMIEVLDGSTGAKVNELLNNNSCQFTSTILPPKIINANLTYTGNRDLLEVNDVERIVMHHTAFPDYNIFDIHHFHQSRGWFGFGYNYFIDFEGNIFEGAGPNVGAHALGYNSTSIGIAFQGDFTHQEMTIEQYEAGVKLTAWLMCVYNIGMDDLENSIVGHNDLGSTLCPGEYFRIEELRLDIKNLFN